VPWSLGHLLGGKLGTMSLILQPHGGAQPTTTGMSHFGEGSPNHTSATCLSVSVFTCVHLLTFHCGQ
jgi:hypothetical protein